MNSVQTVAEMMEIAATTAPKAVGKNFIVTKVLGKSDCRKLAEEMTKYGEDSGKGNFDRDGGNVGESEAVLLVGMKDAAPTGINCGACGFPTCLKINTGDKDSEFLGPQCAIRILDMGIALGSAVKTAQLFNVDNRIMYRIGAVARKIGMIDADFVMGIPMSVTGKSIFFDR